MALAPPLISDTGVGRGYGTRSHDHNRLEDGSVPVSITTRARRSSVRWVGPVRPARKVAVPHLDRALLATETEHGTALYLGIGQLAKLGGFGHAFLPWLQAEGRLIDPDIIIGPDDPDSGLRMVRGWYAPRALDWLTTAGRITPEGRIVRRSGQVAGGKPTRLTRQQAEQVRQAHQSGESVGSLAARFGVPQSTLSGYLARGQERVTSQAYPDPEPWRVEPQRYVSRPEYAARVGITPAHAAMLFRRGKLPAYDVYVSSSSTSHVGGWLEDTIAPYLLPDT